MTWLTGTLYGGRYTFLIIYRSVLLSMRNVSDKSCKENQNIHLCSIIFSRKYCFYEIMWKNITEPDRPQMSAWRLRMACWLTKATNTHSKYVVLIASQLQQWLHKRVFVLRYTYIVYFVIFPFLIPYAVWTETSGRYIWSSDTKCIKNNKKRFVPV